MAKAGTVVIELDANSARLLRELQKAQTRSRSTFRSMQRDAARAGKAIGASIAAVVTAFTALAGRQIAAQNALAKTADKLGITTSALSGLRLAAKQAGIEQNAFDMGLQRLVRRIGEAANASGEAQVALRQLGLDAKALQALPVEQQFLAIADAFQSVDGANQRLLRGFKLFDSEGAQIITLLSRGRSEIEDYIRLARDLRISLTDIETAKIAKAADDFKLARDAVAGLGNVLAVEAAPFVSFLSQKFVEAARETNGFREQIETAFTVASYLAAGFLNILRAIQLSLKGLQLLGLYIERAATAVARFLNIEGFATIQDNIDHAKREVQGLIETFSVPAELQATVNVDDAQASLDAIRQWAADTGIEIAANSKLGIIQDGLERIVALQEQALTGGENILQASVEDYDRRISQLVDNIQEQLGSTDFLGFINPAEIGAALARLRGEFQAQLGSEVAGAGTGINMDQIKTDYAALQAELSAIALQAETDRMARAETLRFDLMEAEILNEQEKQNALAQLIQQEAVARATAKIEAERAVRAAAGLPEEDIDEVEKARLIAEQILQVAREVAAEREKIAAKSAQTQAKIEAAKTKLIQQLNTNLVNSMVGLLQQLAGKSKAAALALIAINKGRAIAAAIMNTAQAVTAALAIDPTGALAARVKAIGAAQVALIAATGFAEAANVGSGGASVGSPSNPVFTQPVGQPGSGAESSASAKSSVQIIFQGDVVAWDDFVQQRVIESIQDAVKDRDVILISNDSRQAQELVNGGS